MNNSKKWWQSRTLWVNALTLFVMIIAQISGWEDMKQYADELLIASNVANMLLRFVTITQIK
jgi:hypothetical protein